MCLTSFPPPFYFLFSRYNRLLDDRGVFVQVRAGVQDVQFVRSSRARCDRLLSGHRLGTFDRPDLRFEYPWKRESPPPHAFQSSD